jgi:microcystin-dependent protein
MSQMGGTFVASVPAVPVGSMQAFAGSSAPTGWLLCDGTAVSRTTYSNLFSVISTTYGVGDGSTTFGLPDMRGRVPMGAGTGNQLNASGSGAITGGTGMTARTAGAFGGEETHLLTTAEMPSHTHTQDSHNHTQNAHNHLLYSGPAGGVHATINQNGNNGALYGPTQTVTATNIATTATNQNTGGGGRSSVVPPFVVLNYVIKAIPDTPRGGMTATFTPPIVTSLPLVPQFGDQVVLYSTTPYAGYQLQQWTGSSWAIISDSRGTGAWTDYSSSQTVSNALTKGNGTIISRYVQTGKIVHWYGSFTLGSTSAVAVGNSDIALPVAASSNYKQLASYAHASYIDTGTALYPGLLICINTTTARFMHFGASGTYATNADLASSVPFTWTTGDIMNWSMTYEAA